MHGRGRKKCKKYGKWQPKVWKKKKFNVRPSTNMSKEVNFGKIACRKCEEGLKSQEITLRWYPLPKMVTKTLVLITLTTAILHEAPFFRRVDCRAIHPLT